MSVPSTPATTDFLMVPSCSPETDDSWDTLLNHHFLAFESVPDGNLTPRTSTIGLVKSQTGDSLPTGASSSVDVEDSATWVVTHPSWRRLAPLGQTWDRQACRPAVRTTPTAGGTRSGRGESEMAERQSCARSSVTTGNPAPSATLITGEEPE